VFGYRAYVYIPQVVHKDKISPKLELMIYISIALEGHGNIFMHSSGNVVLTATYADFVEKLFPCYSTGSR